MHHRSGTRRRLWGAACLVLVAGQVATAAPDRPFAAMAGAWTGQGTIATLTGVEHATCTATYEVAGSRAKLALDCLTESYRLDLTSAVTEARGSVSGVWSERTFGTSGNVSGRRDGPTLSLAANVAGAEVSVVITTRLGRQTVSLRTTSPLLRGGSLVLTRTS